MFTEKPSYSLEWELVTDPVSLAALCVDLASYAVIDCDVNKTMCWLN